MKDVVWGDDPQGRSHGWGDSHFYPRDIARLGYLYLHRGKWKGKQIVPRNWVTMSTAPPTGARSEPGGFGVEWRASNGPNGRQYGGTGRGGQTLIVWPDLDMIVVSTAGGNAGQLTAFTRAADKADQPLPANSPETRSCATQPPRPPGRPRRASPPCRQRRGRFRPGLSVPRQPLAYRQPLADVRRRRHGPRGSESPTANRCGSPSGWTVCTEWVHTDPSVFRTPLRWANGPTDDQFLLDLNFIANINHYTLAIAIHAGADDGRDGQ